MRRPLVWLLLSGIVIASQAALEEGAVSATVAESDEQVELKWQHDGRTVSSSLPLYRSGNVRYFSAGVGAEERSARYPSFALKIIFTAGHKPFLSHVGVTIQPAAGGAATIIPPEQVEGPWLFVDLPPGPYDLSATFRGQVQRLKGITVESGRQKVIHVRWKEEQDSPVHVAEDPQEGGDIGPLGKGDE
ncbi:MAG: hypothetical protein A4E19_05545 [Nitrospira sp. SG-bin1]|nr:MAG: hypothetical protein A4E19_05545 [Nitrospira sp. SG-bin1]